VEVIAGLPWELLYPRRIAVYLTGRLSGWTAPKDVILACRRQVDGVGATNGIVEYIGPGARSISATGRLPLPHGRQRSGAVQPLSRPVRYTAIRLGYSNSQGNPAITSTASAPPTPTAHEPSPPAFGVWESVPMINLPGNA